MGRYGKAEKIAGAVTAALCVAALAAFALPAVGTGAGGRVWGYELLALPWAARRYVRESVGAWIAVFLFWLPLALGAILLALGAAFAGVGRGGRLSTAGKLCETALALTLFDLGFFAVASDLGNVVDEVSGLFSESKIVIDASMRRGPGYWALPVCEAVAAVSARAGDAILKAVRRAAGPDRMGTGDLLELFGAALSRAGALACFLPMVGYGTEAGSGGLFGGALAVAGAGAAMWTDRFFGGMLFWWLLAGVLAVVGAFIAGSESRFHAFPAAATCLMGAACLVMMRLELGSGAVTVGDVTVEVRAVWGWWLAVCALSAAAVCCAVGAMVGGRKRSAPYGGSGYVTAGEDAQSAVHGRE